jgi:YVTN family beta-propeller protein
VWVPSSASGTVDRVDPKTRRVVARIHSTTVTPPPPDNYFDSVAFTKNAVWHASDLGNVVVRIDPRTNKVVAKIPVGGRPDEIAAGPAGVYVGLFQTPTIERISGNRVVKKRTLDGPVYGVAFAAGKLWALSTSGPTVQVLDPLTLAVRKKIAIDAPYPPVGGFASAWWLSADAKTVCVPNTSQNAITIIDPATEQVTTQAKLPFGRQPFSTAAQNGSCWVTNNGGIFLVGPNGMRSAKLPGSVFTGVTAGGWATIAERNALVKVS